MQENEVILDIKNITKTYKNRTVLNNLSFEVYAGEIFGFLGPNGAGKTTLIKTICGLIKPTSGDIFICKHSVTKNFEKAIINLGTLPENFAAYGYMSGLDNLKYYASLYGNISRYKINNVVELVGMSGRIKDKFSTYSFGMKQRLGIAQALLHNPKILILDEPTNGLDANGIIELRKILLNLATAQNMAILVSSHILAEMEQLCDTIAIVNGGKILEMRSMADIVRTIEKTQQFRIKVDYPNYAGKIVTKYFNTPIELAGNSIIFPFSPDKIPQVTATLVKHKISVFGVSQVKTTLEEIYLEILKSKRTHTGIL